MHSRYNRAAHRSNEHPCLLTPNRIELAEPGEVTVLKHNPDASFVKVKSNKAKVYLVLEVLVLSSMLPRWIGLATTSVGNAGADSKSSESPTRAPLGESVFSE